MPSEYQDQFKPLLSFQRGPVGTVGSDCTDFVDDCQVPHSAKRSVFKSSELVEIKRVLLLSQPTELEVCSTYAKYATMRIKGIVYGSSESRVKNTSIVIAQLEAETRPARIEYFAKVSTVVNGTPSSIIMVSLHFFKRHPEKDLCGKPVTICSIDVIKCRTVSPVDKLTDTMGNVLFVSPYY